MQTRHLLMGDEAVARAAIDAGIDAAYGYPGTPSTEILESLIDRRGSAHRYVARWCTNEKAAYEQALGASLAGRRAMVTMKHVGLNVAADPFVNSALVDVAGGLVVAVADDPGMHSSQNEQDTRALAAFARTVCLEPADQQEAYDMTVAAFDLSEELGLPVILRLVTRIAHARGVVHTKQSSGEVLHKGRDGETLGEAAVKKPSETRSTGGAGWTLIPANARVQWAKLVEQQASLPRTKTAKRYTNYVAGDDTAPKAVVTCGIGRAYYDEFADELSQRPHRLHIGYYPFDRGIKDRFPDNLCEVLVLEDGYPEVERALRGLLGRNVEVRGRDSGALPPTGELTPETVREALELPPIAPPVGPASDIEIPGRRPQLCKGCPHTDSFEAINAALSDSSERLRPSDIGCYALGALPPHSIADSVVCMGASIGMAKGAAEAGVDGVVATIGDSTFLHSGIPALIDAVEADTPMTVVILDNSTVAMTGGQPTAVPSSRIEEIVKGIGVDPDHIVTLTPTPSALHDNVKALRKEIDHAGPSVVIARRTCVRFAATIRRRAG